MTAAIFCYSRTGCETARRVLSAFTAHDTVCYTLSRFAQPGFLPLEKGVYGAEFSRCGALIFIGACGIAVREIAPFVRSKKTDPAVLVIDDRARFVIPILSGHIGGANALAQTLADMLHAAAVITTATDIHEKFSVDAWAARNDCAISDMVLAKAFSAAILERDLPLMSVFPIASALPGGIFEAASGKLGVYIGCDTKIALRANAAPDSKEAARRRRLPQGHLRGGGCVRHPAGFCGSCARPARCRGRLFD